MSEATVGVYIHIPFCERVCPYCDFAVVGVRRLDPAVEERYAAGVLRELAARREAFAGRRLASLYLGGGTPSLFRPDTIARLVAAVRDSFSAGAPVETSLEVNPSTVERERLPDFARAGVNRVSLGVQSFDDGVLRRLGRAHRASEARATLRACRDVGFDVLALDLIFAAPGQSQAQLTRDLEEALDFAPEHLSAYELSIEAGTPFATAAARGQLALPDEGEVVALFQRVVGRLEAAGYERYELSNYARPGFEAVHNRRYWERQPVLGLGVGAFSNDPATSQAPFGVRRANLRGVDAYLARVEAGCSPQAGPPEVLSAATARGEAVFLGLRTRRGLDAAAFAAEFGRPPRGFFHAEIELLARQGLLRETASGDLSLSARGRLLADGVFAHFVEPSGPCGD